MNYLKTRKETVSTCIKDAQFKSAKWPTGNVKTTSIYIEDTLLIEMHSKKISNVTHIV